jgi:hypothetical protein
VWLVGLTVIGWAFADASFLLPEPWLMAAYLLAWQMVYPSIHRFFHRLDIRPMLPHDPNNWIFYGRNETDETATFYVDSNQMA